MINKQILVTSINKQIEESKIYGNLDLHVLYFFNLIMYFIDFTDDKEDLEQGTVVKVIDVTTNGILIIEKLKSK